MPEEEAYRRYLMLVSVQHPAEPRDSLEQFPIDKESTDGEIVVFSKAGDAEGGDIAKAGFVAVELNGHNVEEATLGDGGREGWRNVLEERSGEKRR